jgi:hypothetical protein
MSEPMTDEWSDDQKTQPDGRETTPAAPAHAAEPALEIDFGMFVMSLASSVLVHLGEIEHPDSHDRQANLALAKQTLDILGMLQQKTRGNLTQEETQVLENLLYDLRMKYVDAKKR